MIITSMFQGAFMVMIVWLLYFQLPMQSVPITTNVVSLNPTQAKQHYVTYDFIGLCMFSYVKLVIASI